MLRTFYKIFIDSKTLQIPKNLFSNRKKQKISKSLIEQQWKFVKIATIEENKISKQKT